MGCCHSREQRRPNSKEVKTTVCCLPSSEVAPNIVHEKKLSVRNAEKPSELQVHASSAGWMRDASFGDYVRMVKGEDGTLFACLFDPHVTDHAAVFCVERCHAVFLEAMKTSNGDPQRALGQTFECLDQKFLSSNLNPTVRANSGCSGVVVYVDVAEKKSWVANVGTCQCLLGFSAGAFNARYMDGRTIVARHDAENPNERQWIRERFPTEEDLLQTVNGNTMVKGVTNMVRCIGFGFAKDAKLAVLNKQTSKKRIKRLPSTYHPYISSVPQVEVCDLAGGAEALILYSGGMSQLLSPSEMAIFTMHFEKSGLPLKETHMMDEDGLQMSPVSHVQSSQAVSLVRHAASKAAENFEKQSSTLDAPLKGLKSKRRTFDLTSVEDRSSMRMNPDARKYQQASGPDNREEAKGNLACVVISLESTESKRNFSSAPSTTSAIPSEALQRWKLVQLYCRFHIERRRSCFRRWWHLVALAVKHAQRQMLAFDKAQWMKAKDEIHGTAHVTAEPEAHPEENGHTTEPAATFPLKLSPRFRKWLDTPTHNGAPGLMNDYEAAANKALCL